MKIKKYIILMTLAVTCFSAMAQYEYPGETEESNKENGKKKGWYRDSKLFFGGNLGLSFGSYTYIEVAPIVGYRLTPRLSLGLGPKYMYIKERSYYETSVYGLKTFALFAIFKDINETINIGIGDVFVYLENETLNVEPLYQQLTYYPGYPYPYITYYKEPRTWVNVTLVGGGLRFPLGQRAGFSIMILWDVTQNSDYRYSNPEVRISVDF
ncbi:MAG: hypothetical protein PVF73_10720 [Bacteroidales bacterium]|jgi:hypothetical protein